MRRRVVVAVVVALAIVAVFVAATAISTPTEAARRLPPIDCSIVLCPAPDCPIGTKAVILPGDCCFTCVPAK